MSSNHLLTPPKTPDARYIVVKDRLWRASNPALSATKLAKLRKELMAARRAVGVALKTGSKTKLALARRAVNAAKVALGERGPPWWDDGAKDFNRYLVKNSPYADWYARRMRLCAEERG